MKVTWGPMETEWRSGRAGRSRVLGLEAQSRRHLQAFKSAASMARSGGYDLHGRPILQPVLPPKPPPASLQTPLPPMTKEFLGTARTFASPQWSSSSALLSMAHELPAWVAPLKPKMRVLKLAPICDKPGSPASPRSPTFQPDMPSAASSSPTQDPSLSPGSNLPRTSSMPELRYRQTRPKVDAATEVRKLREQLEMSVPRSAPLHVLKRCMTMADKLSMHGLDCEFKDDLKEIGTLFRKTVMIYGIPESSSTSSAPTPRGLEDLSKGKMDAAHEGSSHANDAYSPTSMAAALLASEELAEAPIDLSSAYWKLEVGGELHVNVLYQALRITGVDLRPDTKIIAEAVGLITKFEHLSYFEFICFAQIYQKQLAASELETFKLFDKDANGRIDYDELIALLTSFGIIASDDVVASIVQEVMQGEAVELGIKMDQFHNLLKLIQMENGFTAVETRSFSNVFNKFDVGKPGRLSIDSIFLVLHYIGYTYRREHAMLEDLIEDTDRDPQGCITEKAFLTLLKKLREQEIAAIKRYHSRCEAGTSWGLAELRTTLLLVGHRPEPSAMKDAAAEAGIELNSTSVHISEVWRFIVVYRRNRGLSHKSLDEISRVFKGRDPTASGELQTFEVNKMLRSIGCPVHVHQCQLLIPIVEPNSTGSITLSEMVLLVSKLREMELEKLWNLIQRQAADGDDASLREVTLANLIHQKMLDHRSGKDEQAPSPIITPARRASMSMRRGGGARAQVGTSADWWLFAEIATQALDDIREKSRCVHGLDDQVVEAIRLRCDSLHHGPNAQVNPQEMRAMLQEMFPKLTTIPETRKQLKLILQEQVGFGLMQVLRLVAHCTDIAEEDLLKRERQAIARTGFTIQEVIDVRELFMGHQNKQRMKISLLDMKVMLAGIVPMGQKNSEELRNHLKEVIGPDGQLEAEFPEFLLVMRRLLNANFAGLATACADAARSARTSSN